MEENGKENVSDVEHNLLLLPHYMLIRTYISIRSRSTKEKNGTKNRSTFGRSFENGRFDRGILKACVYPSWIMGP